MTWTYHDDFRTEEEARSYGDKIIRLGFSKGAKVKANKKKKRRPFELYIHVSAEK